MVGVLIRSDVCVYVCVCALCVTLWCTFSRIENVLWGCFSLECSVMCLHAYIHNNCYVFTHLLISHTPTHLSHTLRTQPHVHTSPRCFTYPHIHTASPQVHDVLISARLCRDDITHMVKACPVTWRPELGAVLARCASGDVPVLVFSAGLAGRWGGWVCVMIACVCWCRHSVCLLYSSCML